MPLLTALRRAGYGDATPVTAGGRLVGAVVMLVGILMIALPITGACAPSWLECDATRATLAAACREARLHGHGFRLDMRTLAVQ